MSDEKVKMENYTLDIPCPRCGGHEYTNGRANNEWNKTTYWCKKGRGVNPCMGYLCFCKKCEKIYPETKFGKHGDVYECKECGTVQWDYTDYKREEERFASVLSSIPRFY